MSDWLRPAMSTSTKHTMFVNVGCGQKPQLLEHWDRKSCDLGSGQFTLRHPQSYQPAEKEVPTSEGPPTPKANRQVCNLRFHHDELGVAQTSTRSQPQYPFIHTKIVCDFLGFHPPIQQSPNLINVLPSLGKSHFLRSIPKC